MASARASVALLHCPHDGAFVGAVAGAPRRLLHDVVDAPELDQLELGRKQW